MFLLKLQDRNGKELSEGDIVAIIDIRQNISFYCQVTYMEDQQAIAPFHTFSFHSVEKVNYVPDGALPFLNEERYKAWYMPDAENDKSAGMHDKYLMSWRECEYQLDKRAYRIERIDVSAASNEQKDLFS